MREDKDIIVDRRRKKKSTVLLTGGTGFLGSFMLSRLLKEGYPVLCLCRPKHNVDAFARMRRILEWHAIDSHENVEVIEGNITQPRLGLDGEAYAYLRNTINEIWHCTSDSSFAPEKRGQVKNVNIKGTSHMLELAKESRCSFFHYMSTAYIFGKSRGICKEEYRQQDRFYNIYEETKHEAEGRVIGLCEQEGIRLNIYRPSIVYGDTQTGKSLKFNAFYFPIRIIHYFKNLFEKDFEETGGVNARRMGIERSEDGEVNARIRVGKGKKSSFNLVPVDFVIEACMEIMEKSLDGAIFHLVSRELSRLEEVIAFTEDYFRIKNLFIPVLKEDFKREPKNELERLMDSYMDVYEPYFYDERAFDDERASGILDKEGIRCPKLTYEIFARCVDYAIKLNWGKGLNIL